MSDVTLTPYPTDAATRALPSAKTGDSRVNIVVPAGTTWQHDDWTLIVTVDGVRLFIRRADCGAGCRCAAEIAAAPESRPARRENS